MSQITGITVRTLHHYDAIDLLKPTKITAAGYRLYDDTALQRLQTILFYRELQFPLKEIRRILDNERFDPAVALSQQIELLELQYSRLGELLIYARKIQERGVNVMDFTAFDKNKIEQYKEEVKERWGTTPAYQESEMRKVSDDAPQQMMERFKQFAKVRHLPPESEEAQRLAAELQQHITDNYYTCTKEIFRGLGELYASDERFRQNIDKEAGEGTAAFVSRVIAVYCAK